MLLLLPSPWFGVELRGIEPLTSNPMWRFRVGLEPLELEQQKPAELRSGAKGVRGISFRLAQAGRSARESLNRRSRCAWHRQCAGLSDHAKTAFLFWKTHFYWVVTSLLFLALACSSLGTELFEDNSPEAALQSLCWLFTVEGADPAKAGNLVS